VRAYNQEVSDSEVLPENGARLLRLLRLERLAPAVLLALFDGVPIVVHVEEPRQGIQFGVDLDTGGDGTTAKVHLRDARTARLLGQTVDVPFRADSPGVISIAALAAKIAAVSDTHVVAPRDAVVSSSELAMQLLQFPYRQVFGPTPASGDGGSQILTRFEDLFNPTIGGATIRRWSGGTT
jgi:hypothetical protein